MLPSSKGEFDVACDYIHIETSGSSHERIPFVVLPHILSDLPVYLVWAGDPSKDDPLCYQLEQFANRLIFDSESTDNLPRFAKSVLDQYEKSHCDVADLNWARIESWREMLSMAFYSDDKLKQIENAKKDHHQLQFTGIPILLPHQDPGELSASMACLPTRLEFLSVRNEKNRLHL